MRSIMLIAALLLAPFAWGAHAADLRLPPAAFDDENVLAQSMPLLAKALLAKQEPRPGDETALDNRFRIQAVAGDLKGALQTLTTLRGLRDRAGVAAIIPFEISIRAALQKSSPDPVPAAFRSVFAKLDDPTAAFAIRALRTDARQLRRFLQFELDDLREAKTLSVEQATQLVRVYSAVERFRLLSALPSTLIDEDDQRRYLIDTGLQVRTPDGAMICAFTVRQRSAKAPLATLLEFTIYTDIPNNMVGARLSASQGYAGAVGYTRGKACSPETPVPYEHDGSDASALIDWLSRQEWSDGRIGMFGGSYSGFTSWAAAKRRPPALKAIMVGSPATPAIDVPMEGNVFWSFVYPWPFYTTNNKTLDNATYNDNARWNQLTRTFYKDGLAYRDLDRIDGTPNPVFRKWLSHPAYDSYWQAMMPYRDEFATIDIPVLQTAGYFFGGPGGAPYIFDQHLKHRPQAEHFLVIGPYDHMQAQRGTITALGERSEWFAGYQLDPVAQVDFIDLRYKWFDHVLKGAQRPTILKDRVNYQLMAANEWRHASSFDGMAATRRRLHLGTAREGDSQALQENAGTPTGTIRLDIDLKDRSDIDQPGAGGIVSDAIDRRNAVTFVSQPFETAMDTAGLFSAHLEFITNKKDFDLQVTLYELTPQGNYVMLSPVMARMSYARDPTRRQLLEPGQRTQIDVRSIRPMGRRLQRGSRLVVVLGLIKNAGQQINYGSGKDVSDETIADAGDPVRVDWLTSSYVEIPLKP